MADQKQATLAAPVYRSLLRRNSAVAALRLLVPLLGLVVLTLLLVQIIIANLADDFGMSGARIQNDKLIIDSPKYGGVMANGTKYTINSEAAATSLGNAEIVELTKAQFFLARPDAYSLQAASENAQFDMVDQKVKIAGMMVVSDNRGMQANLLNSIISWTDQSLFTKDYVEITFEDGSVITGKTLEYDAGSDMWNIGQVRILIPITGESE